MCLVSPLVMVESGGKRSLETHEKLGGCLAEVGVTPERRDPHKEGDRTGVRSQAAPVPGRGSIPQP
jgi:hypothetical protein